MLRTALLVLALVAVAVLVVRSVRSLRRSSQPAVLSPSDRRLIDTGIGLSRLGVQPPRGSWGPGTVLGAHTRRAPAPSSGHPGSSVPTFLLDDAFGLTHFGQPAHLDRHPVIDGEVDYSRCESDPRLDKVEGPKGTPWWLGGDDADSESDSPEAYTAQPAPFAATVETHVAPEPSPKCEPVKEWWTQSSESTPAAAPAPEPVTSTYSPPAPDPTPSCSAPDTSNSFSSDTTSYSY